MKKMYLFLASPFVGFGCLFGSFYLVFKGGVFILFGTLALALTAVIAHLHKKLWQSWEVDLAKSIYFKRANNLPLNTDEIVLCMQYGWDIGEKK